MSVLKILFLKLKRLSRARSWRELRRLFNLVFYDVESTRQELQLLATNLIDVTTMIDLQAPIHKLFSGHAHIDSRGVRIIEVHPSVDLDVFYGIVLHEVGHHILHITEEDKHKSFVDETVAEMRAVGEFFEHSSEDRAEYEADPGEVEAENFKRSMDCIAQRRALAEFGNDETRTRIHVLQNIKIMKQKGE